MPSRVETEAKLLTMYRTLRLVGVPYTLPGTPKDRVIILQDVMLTPEDMDKAIRELPRDRDVVELFKKLAGADPLPPR